MTRIFAALIAGVIAGPVFADAHGSGDAEAGEKGFKKCKACHMIASESETIVKGGKTGPNMYGVAGRTAGTVEGFKYSGDLVAAGEAGLVWDEASLVAFTADPKKFLQEFLDNSKAKSKMSFKLKKGGEDIYAYLVSVGPEASD